MLCLNVNGKQIAVVERCCMCKQNDKKYKGIYWHANEIPNICSERAIADIDEIIERFNYEFISSSRELSLAVTKLQEAQLWLSQISG